uniref:Uncharacterized protein n=1 Tax=Anguilla anguilla TaxID=7936 RepID=A0A0E9Q8J8_ANGAN
MFISHRLSAGSAAPMLNCPNGTVPHQSVSLA